MILAKLSCDYHIGWIVQSLNPARDPSFWVTVGIPTRIRDTCQECDSKARYIIQLENRHY